MAKVFYLAQLDALFYGIKPISNRIFVAKVCINRTKDRKIPIFIINVYAPNSIAVQQDPTNAEIFYDMHNKTIDDCECVSYVNFIAGDFHSLDPTLRFMGKYCKGTRDRDSHLLANFLAERDLFAVNTAFNHYMRHRSTW